MELILIAVGSIVVITIAFISGWKLKAKNLRRMTLRKPDGNGTLSFAIAPNPDGSMELLITNATLKRVKRGEVVSGEVIGAKDSMVFKIKKVD